MTIDLFFEKWGPGHSGQWAGFRSDLTELIESGGDRAVVDAKDAALKCAAEFVNTMPGHRSRIFQPAHALVLAMEDLEKLGWTPGG